MKRKIICGIVLLGMLLWSVSGCSSRQKTVTGETDQNGQIVKEPKGYFRVLIAGEDRVSGLSDVWMLVSWNRDTDEVWVLQLPRDTYAAYAEQSYQKLNGAPLALGGMEQTAEFLSESLGISIDHYAALSPDVFCRAVDALGGVEIFLKQPLRYRDPAQGLIIDLEAGRHTLNGAQAEQFVRYRAGYARGDLDRMDAQKIFLSALFRTVCQTKSPLKLCKLAVSLLGEMETDLSVMKTLSLLPELLRLDADAVHFVTAPGMDATATVSGASYYVLSRDGMSRLLVERFGAEGDGFDPNGVFLHPKYEHFQAIYHSDLAYEAVSASEKQKED